MLVILCEIMLKKPLLLFFILLSGFCSSQNNATIKEKLSILTPKYLLNNVEASEGILLEALEAANAANNKEDKLLVIFNFGKLEYYKGNTTKALDFFSEALEMAIKQNNKPFIKNLYYTLGTVNRGLSNLKEASDYFTKAISLYDDNERTKSLIYSELSKTHSYLGLTAEAINFANKGLLLGKQQNDSLAISVSTNYLIASYLEENNLEKAYKLIKDNEPYVKAVDLSIINYNLNENYVNYYLKINKLDAALKYALAGLKEVESENLLILQAKARYFLGKIYFLKNDYNTALTNLNEAYRLAKLKNQPTTVYQITVLLANLHTKKLEHLKANKFFAESMNLKDSIASKVNLQLVSSVNLKYENQKEEKELAENKLIIKEQEYYINNRKTQFMIVSISFLLALLLMFAGFFYFKQRQRIKNQEIKSLKTSLILDKLGLIAQGEEKAKNRIAEDIHDGVNGDLSVLKYKLSAIKKGSTTLEKDLLETIAMLDNSIDRLREVSHDLSSVSTKGIGIKELITQYCDRIKSANKIAVIFESYGEEVQLDDATTNSLYKVFQELIQNILKHSKADDIFVQLSNNNNLFTLTVEDNGIGFNVFTAKKGMGLINVHSRVSLLGGTYEVISNNTGTSSVVEINLEEKK